MKFYFSGISDPDTFAMLEAARVQNILVDHQQIRNLPEQQKIGILDSGAFRHFRASSQISLNQYRLTVKNCLERAEFIVAPDVINDPQQSFLNWLAVKDTPVLKSKLFPVWQWNAPFEYLQKYLDNAPVVGIGGLAQIFRNDTTPEECALREETLELLLYLCQKFPQRFHIFGLNYLTGIQQLGPFAYSADSSVWLRGARYGYLIFQHSKTKNLTQAPARNLPFSRHFNREQRCIANAKNIENFLSKH